MSYLSIENLSIKLGDFELSSLNLAVDKGEYAVIIGPTGAGKSILLECIIGFWAPEKGKIILEGRDIVNDLPEKRGIGIVYQDYALLPHLTVFQNIAYGLKKLKEKRIQEKVEEMARSLNIHHLLTRMPGTLSGGEQQRTALARSLIVNPRLLLMDEPLSALDPGTRKEIRKLLVDVIDKTFTTVVHVTHDMKDLWALADKVAVLRNGEIVQTGGAREVFARPKDKLVAEFVGASFWEARVESIVNQTTHLKTIDFNIFSKDKAIEGETVQVAVRPEEIKLYKSPPDNLNGANLYKTCIKQVTCEGEVWAICVNIGDTPVVVNSTQNMISELYPEPGDMVYARIDMADVRIIH